jgi:transcriptional/translational regulatory protein YebC/TACO1
MCSFHIKETGSDKWIFYRYGEVRYTSNQDEADVFLAEYIESILQELREKENCDTFIAVPI